MKLTVVLFAALCVCVRATPVSVKYPAFFSGARVVGGLDAERNQFPYQVSMQWGLLGSFQHICGGSIISTQTILTAGHCITESPTWLGSFRIKAGILLLNEDVDTLQTIAVQSSIVHPSYAGGVNPHDVALLRLASALTLTNAVSVISLPAAGSVPTGTAVLSGWGAINGQGTTIPNHLQWVEKPILTLQECSNALTALMGSDSPLDQTNVCAGPLTGGISACSGDSGGPFAQNGAIVGVVSWGMMPCGTVGAPSVYVGVSNYIPWILENTV